ncbi:peptidase M61 [Ascidiimonas aurantiaca]|uniref:M61 family metallopeptidase n=1 Tax=Ascidiimonas aurantiaca TaxID=1685432 RepID=UPI0030EE2CFC
MKKILLIFGAALTILSCSPKINDLASQLPVTTTIDLVNVNEDKVQVELDPGRFTSESITFYIPKTVPGTYSTDNYGQYIENIKAFDYNNNLLEIVQNDMNSWQINNATNLDRLTYWVNDTYDTEAEKENPVFSPAGTNIESGKNFILNLHGFVGYFDGFADNAYELRIHTPKNLEGFTGLVKTTTPDNLINQEYDTDIYLAGRYFEVIDNPILYAEPDYETFQVNDIEVTLSVYSPNKVYSAASIKEDMQTMMRAQKNFLGDINSTRKYNILLYLSTMEENDARGFGALEHHTSTTVVLPESMGREALAQTMIDVVSHEFFHIVSPLSIHSEEVHFFDYNDPKMSEHLWMYEGVTEYFANLFQINQGLISENDFYERINTKIERSMGYDDEMSFTEMSKNILESPYKENYANVYEKGALIGMCLDLIIREKSNGEKGVLWLTKQLSEEYGKDKPFKDEEIIERITALTYPEVGSFFEKHVQGNTPIDYSHFFDKVGLTFGKKEMETGYFFKGQTPYINVNESNGTIFVREGIALNGFYNSLGLKGGDIIKSINGMEYSLDNIRDMIGVSFSWKPGDAIEVIIEREGTIQTLSGQISAPVAIVNVLNENESATEQQKTLRQAWLKG